MLWHFNKNQFMIPYFRVIKTFHILLPIQAALFLFLYYLLNIIEPTKCTVFSINLELLRYTGVSRNICMCYWLVLYFIFIFLSCVTNIVWKPMIFPCVVLELGASRNQQLQNPVTHTLAHLSWWKSVFSSCYVTWYKKKS